MGLPQNEIPLITIDQYLAMERASLERHEYLDGVIYAMAGENLPHGDISMNVSSSLHLQLRGKPCRALSKDMKVRSGPRNRAKSRTKGMFSYPDVLVVCGEPVFYEERRDIILNPTVIIEVLSKSTEAFDRGEKFSRFRKHNPSLKDYLLISQLTPQIDHFERRPGKWEYQVYDELETIVTITSIGCILKLADVYERIEFPPDEGDLDDEVNDIAAE